MEVSLRAAKADEMKEVHGLLMAASATGVILPRSLSDLYGHTRDFMLLRDGRGSLIGCCALSIVWEDLAEVRSLFIKEERRRSGHGRALVRACFAEAGKLGIHRVFTLTYQKEFFGSLGFAEVGKDTLPQKIWADCVHCPKFPDCDEIAMLVLL